MTTSTDAATRRDLFGGVLAAAASLQFGVIVVVGKRVLERGMTVESMLAFRFWVAASLLVLVLVVLRRPLLAAPRGGGGPPPPPRGAGGGGAGRRF